MDSASEVNSELRSRIRLEGGRAEPGRLPREYDSSGKLLRNAAVDDPAARSADSRDVVERVSRIIVERDGGVRAGAEPAPGATVSWTRSSDGGRDE